MMAAAARAGPALKGARRQPPRHPHPSGAAGPGAPRGRLLLPSPADNRLWLPIPKLQENHNQATGSAFIRAHTVLG